MYSCEDCRGEETDPRALPIPIHKKAQERGGRDIDIVRDTHPNPGFLLGALLPVAVRVEILVAPWDRWLVVGLEAIQRAWLAAVDVIPATIQAPG